MPYYKVLRRMISDTSYTQEQIAQKCTEDGTQIGKSYINKLLNNKQPAPTEKISRAIAKVCGADERLLVIEGYLDKAPKEIKDAFISLKYNTRLLGMNIFGDTVDRKTLNSFRQALEDEPLADFILELIDNRNGMLDMTELPEELKTSFEKIQNNLVSSVALKAENDAMYPLIKENDKIILEVKNNYDNGDIVWAKIEKENKTVIRQMMKLNKFIQLIPLNKKYLKEEYEKDNVLILGKVKKIITEISL